MRRADEYEKAAEEEGEGDDSNRDVGMQGAALGGTGGSSAVSSSTTPKNTQRSSASSAGVMSTGQSKASSLFGGLDEDDAMGGRDYDPLDGSGSLALSASMGTEEGGDGADDASTSTNDDA